MKTLVFDTETTIYEKGDPFSKHNKLVVVGWKALWKSNDVQIAWIDSPIGLDEFSEDFNECTDVVGFNLKFDLHWIRSKIFTSDLYKKRFWDSQLGEYVLSNQQRTYPSLHESCTRRGGPSKLDVIKLNYWDKGINTDLISKPELEEYLKQDVECTEWLYNAQAKDWRDNPGKFKIYRLSCDDLKVLEEMETNGLKIDKDLAQQRLYETNNKIEKIDKQLKQFSRSCPINWDSNDHLSAILFGGKVIISNKEVAGVYKSGPKIGEVRYKWVNEVFEFQPMYLAEPEWEVAKTKKLTDYQLQADGKWRIYFTNDSVINSLKDKNGLLALLKERASLTKLMESYEKLTEIGEVKGWPDNMIHGKFNQVVARTGRLSSSDPNLQNYAEEVRDVFISRF